MSEAEQGSTARTLRFTSWNVSNSSTSLDHLLSDPFVDVGLLQEAPRPSLPPDRCVPDPSGVWSIGGWETRPSRTAIVNVSGAYRLEPVSTQQIGVAGGNELAVSRPGTVAAALVQHSGRPLVLCSMYAPWERPLGKPNGRCVVADASAHRLASDLTALVDAGHDLVAAGDPNVLRGYGEKGSDHWKRRYDSFFDRMGCLGLAYVELDGTVYEPKEGELPNVATFKPPGPPASRQLDHVFASTRIADRVSARALNSVDEWGPSDHCRIVIEVAP